MKTASEDYISYMRINFMKIVIMLFFDFAEHILTYLPKKKISYSHKLIGANQFLNALLFSDLTK